jgi:alpha-L-fucosidase
MNAFRDSYWGLSKTFNPQQFDADKMMSWAKRVGFKYAVSGT